MRQSAGFTILELSVVLALMALMAGVVAISTNGRLRGAHQEQAIQAIQSLDHRARHQARTGSGRVTLAIDTRNGEVNVCDQRESRETIVDSYRPPEGLEIVNAWVLLNGRRVEHTTLSIPFDTRGISPTYGFTIRGEDAEGDSTTTCLLIAGVSGQVTEFDDEDEVLDILSQITRHDAD